MPVGWRAHYQQAIHLGVPKAGELASGANMGFPSGTISVRDASYEDVTSGKHWVMPQATDVKFLKVQGTIVIGNVQLPYHFTLVKYYLSKEVGNVKTSGLRMTFTMMKGGGSCNNTSCINTSQKNKQQ